MAEILEISSNVSFIAAGVLTFIAIVLWIRLDIKEVIGDLSGKNAKKMIEEISNSKRKITYVRSTVASNPAMVNNNYQNTVDEQTGVLNDSYEETEILEATRNEGNISQEVGIINDNKEETGLLNDSKEETGLLDDSSEETEILKYDDNETGMLDDSSEETGILGDSYEETEVINNDYYNEGLEYNEQGRIIGFNMLLLEEIMIVHTEEEIF